MNQFNTKGHSRLPFWALLGLLLGLCFVRYALQVNIPLTMLLAVAVLIGLLGDRDEIIAMCICCIPLHTSLQYTYVLLFCLALYVVKYSRSIRLNLSVIPILLMILWELLHCFGKSFSIPAFVNDCLPLLLLAVLMCSKEEYDYNFIVRALAVSIAGMCLCLLGKLVYLSNYNLVAAINGLRRLGLDAEGVQSSLTVVGGQQNPNTLGIQCVLAITGLIQLRNTGRKKRGDLGLMLFLLVFGALTSSRTYLACLAIMAVLFLFGQQGSFAAKLRFLGSIMLIIAVALLMLYLCFPNLLEFYYSRFFLEDISTGRMDLMGIYHQFIVSNYDVLFFGIGLHDFINKIMVEYHIASMVPHNGIQELIIAWGIPGILLFMLMWLSMVLCSRGYCKKQKLLNFIPLLVILVKVQAGQMLDSPYTMMAFSYAYLSLCADLTPKGEHRILIRTKTRLNRSRFRMNPLRRRINHEPHAENG